MGVKCMWKRGCRASQALHRLGLVRGVVVGDQMQVEIGRGRRSIWFRNRMNSCGAMARHALADDGARLHVERGEQRRGAVPLVVVRHRAAAALLQGKPGWVRSSAWIWTLLIDRQHQCPLRRIDIEADDIAAPSRRTCGSLDSLKVLTICGFSPGSPRSAERWRGRPHLALPCRAGPVRCVRPAARASVSSITARSRRRERRSCRGGRIASRTGHQHLVM